MNEIVVLVSSSSVAVKFRKEDNPTWGGMHKQLSIEHGPGIFKDAEGFNKPVNTTTQDQAVPPGIHQYVTQSAAGANKRAAETCEEKPEQKRMHVRESLAQRLDEKYLEHWKEARNDVTNHGRLPAGLRDMNSALHDGHGLGDHFPLTERWRSFAGIIWFASLISETYYAEHAQDQCYDRSLALMSLIGMPGSGKTTLLTELCYELFRLLSDEKNSIISLIMAALKLGSDCRQEADSFVETLLRSLQPGRQLVIWFRMDKAATLHKQEGSVSQAMALRYLYGCLTYLDASPVPSPCGSYQEFLENMDPEIQEYLTTSAVLRFLERACKIDPSERRVVWVLVDELNACSGRFPSNAANDLHFGQELAAEHVRFCADQRHPDKKCLPLLVTGTSRVKDANMHVTSNRRARTGVIPLPLLSEADTGQLLLDMAQRVTQALGKPHIAEDFTPPWMQRQGVCRTLVRLSGGNPRCLAILLASAIGKIEHTWRSDKLWQLLVHDKLPEGQSTTGWLQNVLESIVGIGTSTKLRSASTGQRLQMARQALTHVLWREPIMLGREVPGTDVRWSDLLEEGLIHPVFATPQSPEVFQEEVYLSPGGRVDYTVGSWLPSYLQGKIGKVYTQKHLFTRDSDSASCGASAIVQVIAESNSSPQYKAAAAQAPSAVAAAASQLPACPQQTQSLQAVDTFISPDDLPLSHLGTSPAKSFGLPSDDGTMILAGASNNPACVLVIAQMAPVMLLHMTDALGPELDNLGSEEHSCEEDPLTAERLGLASLQRHLLSGSPSLAKQPPHWGVF